MTNLMELVERYKASGAYEYESQIQALADEWERMQWVSVKDRLPEVKKRVLVKNFNGYVSMGTYHEVSGIQSDGQEGSAEWWQGDNGYSLDNIIEWMDVPNPPANGGKS